MERYWVYLDNKVQGPVEIPALRKLFGFNLLTQVCVEGQESWRMADDVIEIKAYFASPPRGSSLALEAQPELPPMVRPQIEMILPESAVATQTAAAAVFETLPGAPQVMTGNTAPAPAAETSGLRVPCAICGYKNPRDVASCMKCGSPLKSQATGVEEFPKISLNTIIPTRESEKEAVTIIHSNAVHSETPVMNAAGPTLGSGSPMVDIPVKRIALTLLGIVLAGTVFFGIRHLWKSWRNAKSSAARTVVIQSAPEPSKGAHSTTRAHSSGRSTARKRSSPNRSALAGKAAVLPGVSSHETPPAPARTQEVEPIAQTPVHRSTPRSEPRQSPARQVSDETRLTRQSANEQPTSSEPASYSVVSQAYPIKHRTSAPVDSKYAVKRRGEGGLWSGREDEAIQMVQNQRIYGGLRTIRRNADILMQILRDREYTSAFESGKRMYLFNDVDWAATQQNNPVYEVQLTFAGGREADGGSRVPLRFAYQVDLERRTVEPGGSGMIRSNTMHAFYDESRIPPEERRATAKDTEELVKAAQPGASPLTLESVSKQYAATYSYSALTRVADAYGLTLVTKKLARQKSGEARLSEAARATASVNDVLPETQTTGQAQSNKAGTGTQTGAASTASQKEKPKVVTSASGSIQYSMEKGNGKERLLTVTAPSRATPTKLWETLTAYDRYTQFIPDILISQREGQDGPAIIVHTVSLTRLMFFVFKINLHLRVLEHPRQNRLEFERLAGDFEKFSGYIEITPDPTGTRSTMELHLTLAPKGFVPQWALRSMTQKFLLPLLDAIRAKAESY